MSDIPDRVRKIVVEHLGVEEDKVEALKLIVSAAEAGDYRAQYNAAKMYRDGDGAVADYGEAVKWYRLAAEAGYAKAQAGLGQRYARGQGVEQDMVEALFWTTLAARQRLERAVTAGDEMRAAMIALRPRVPEPNTARV